MDIRVYVQADELNGTLTLYLGRGDDYGDFMMAISELTHNKEEKSLNITLDRFHHSSLGLVGKDGYKEYWDLPVTHPARLVQFELLSTAHHFCLIGASLAVAIEMKRFAGTRSGIVRLKPPILMGQSVLIELEE